MQPNKPFCLWTLEEVLGEHALPSREKPDLSNAPLDFSEREMLHEARARVAEQEQSNWRIWLGLD